MWDPIIFNKNIINSKKSITPIPMIFNRNVNNNNNKHSINKT